MNPQELRGMGAYGAVDAMCDMMEPEIVEKGGPDGRTRTYEVRGLKWKEISGRSQ